MTRRVAAWIAVAAVVAACAGVLGLRTRAEPKFAHRAHVTAGVACTTCHAGIERAGDDGPLHLPTEASCLGCHEQPHDRRPCFECHSDPFAAAAVIDARAHLRFAHRDHASVGRGGCIDCHRGIAAGDGPLRPTMATCFRCHEGERDRRDCDACHVDLAEEGTLPASHLVHDGDWVRDHGARAAASADICAACHTERSCASCHGVTTAALPSRLAFDEPGTASVHRAGFRSRHAIEARAEPGACQTCHSPSTCATCHRDRGVGDVRDTPQASPHPPGWVGLARADNQHGRAARLDPAGCASCHGGAGEALCVECHRVGGVGGSPHPDGWSSRQSLTDLPCRMCHEGGR
jgi:hypothetical protein